MDKASISKKIKFSEKLLSEIKIPPEFLTSNDDYQQFGQIVNDVDKILELLSQILSELGGTGEFWRKTVDGKSVIESHRNNLHWHEVSCLALSKFIGKEIRFGFWGKEKNVLLNGFYNSLTTPIVPSFYNYHKFEPIPAKRLLSVLNLELEINPHIAGLDIWDTMCASNLWFGTETGLCARR